MYIFYGNKYKDKIKELIKIRYELRNRIVEMIKDSEIYEDISSLTEKQFIDKGTSDCDE